MNQQVDREQPLNREIGKREADAMYRRKDINESRLRQPVGKDFSKDQLLSWINGAYPDGFPSEWFD